MRNEAKVHWLLGIPLALAAAVAVAQSGEAPAAPASPTSEHVPPPAGPYITSRRYLNMPEDSPWNRSRYGAGRMPFPRDGSPYVGPGRYWAPQDWAHAHGRTGQPSMDVSPAPGSAAGDADGGEGQPVVSTRDGEGE